MRDLSSINVNLLVALDALLTDVSVSKAAQRHGVSPSAMSHNLRQLRELFEDALLVRTRHGMHLSPLGERLRPELRRALQELGRVVNVSPAFDPTSSRRGFVLSAPDFLSTFLFGPLARVIGEEAPGIDIEVRPLQRLGQGLSLEHAWHLEEGIIDLVCGAIIPDVAGIHRERLYDESFVCVVASDHPCAGQASLTLDDYAHYDHIVITITDERSPTFLDQELESRGLSRHVRVRTRYFNSAPMLLDGTELVLSCPRTLARYMARYHGLCILEPPIPLLEYSEFQAWHERFDNDPGLRWFRSKVAEAARMAQASLAED